jgi:hypothetical protein
MKRSAWLSALICLNLILVTGLVVFGVPPRAAAAQGTGLSGNYLVVTGEIQSKFDALYMIDLRERTLHWFYFQKGSNDLQYGGYRSLERDFRNN